MRAALHIALVVFAGFAFHSECSQVSDAKVVLHEATISVELLFCKLEKTLLFLPDAYKTTHSDSNHLLSRTISSSWSCEAYL